ncbi:mannose-1-phosphate guanylyltransferase/mannose-6-phosphate isomerase [Alphaproteobacteria bacterium]|nr:mannose-1-phosphate guanylyltransferase/mannose-6-phosphate isomerase [Alphaproteobacteria bacterium]
MNDITPILLAGGSGTRLWPLSRKSYPKQFINIVGDTSLFQKTALRLTSTENIMFKPHIIVTNTDYRFFVSQQLLNVGIDPGPIIIEPEAKNTAPAILSAILFGKDKDEETIFLVAPSDHIISNSSEFHKVINKGLKEVKKGKIVTFGIKPTHAETGYGYLELGKVKENEIVNLTSFIEKPDKKKAEKMILLGNYLWNSGIFLFRAKDIILLYKKFAQDILNAVQKSLKTSKTDLGFLRLDPNVWSKCKNISIDYAIMEKADNLSVIPFTAGWSDLGDWDAVWNEMEPDKNGVSLSSHAHAVSCNNTLLRSESKHQEIIGFGLNNIVAIATPDAVLIAHKDKVQNIKDLLAELKSKNISQIESSLKDHRPWGSFENLSMSNRFKVKKLNINPGASLSLQSHDHRSEHWVIIEGTARVTIGKKIKLINEGESIFVPQRAIHRIENPSTSPIILIEVQLGKYLSEDDIVRYEDIYSRE